MRAKKETIWFMSVTMMLATAICAQEAVSAPAANRQTARAALDKVQAKARAWHADAVLIEVTIDVDDKSDRTEYQS